MFDNFFENLRQMHIDRLLQQPGQQEPQQERMYSEEEVRRIASRAFLIKSNNETILEDFDKWFEQFKKK